MDPAVEGEPVAAVARRGAAPVLRGLVDRGAGVERGGKPGEATAEDHNTAVVGGPLCRHAGQPLFDVVRRERPRPVWMPPGEPMAATARAGTSPLRVAFGAGRRRARPAARTS